MRNAKLYLSSALLMLMICASAAFPQTFTIGPTVPIDKSQVFGPTGWSQLWQDIASSGDEYLAVWVDMRETGNYDLYATRISAEKEVLDPAGIRLTTTGMVSGKPSVCWNGVCFFVVYTTNVGVSGTQICGLSVSQTGHVIHDEPVVIASGRVSNPSVADHDSGMIVVWEGLASGNQRDIYYARLNDWAGLLDPTPRVASDRSTDERYPRVASIAGRSLIVWSDWRNPVTPIPDYTQPLENPDIYGLFVDTWGGPLTPGVFPICRDNLAQLNPDVCSAGDHFKVVWSSEAITQKPTTPVSWSHRTAIRGTTISWNGSFLDPNGVTISDEEGAEQTYPRIAWDGYQFLTAWMCNTRPGGPAVPDIFAGRLDVFGYPLDGSGFAVCAEEEAQTQPSVASAGGQYLVGWLDRRNSASLMAGGFGYHVRGVGVDPLGSLVSSDFPFASAAPYQRVASTAFNGQVYLVCWETWRNGQWEISGAIGPEVNGVLETGPAFSIGVSSGRMAAPSTIQNGQYFLVVWLDGNRIMRALVKPDGIVSDAVQIATDTTNKFTSMPSLATDGEHILVAYESGTVRYALLDRPDFSITNGNLQTGPGVYSYHDVAACWTGQCYVIAWKSNWDSKKPTTSGGIGYATLDRSGAVVMSPQLILDIGYPDYPRLACNGNSVLLLRYGPDIRTQRLNLDGTLRDPAPLTIPGTLGAGDASVAWDGSHYVVTWSAARQVGSGSRWQDDIQAIRLNPDNTLFDTQPFAVTNTPCDELHKLQYSTPDRNSLLTFSGWLSDGYENVRSKSLLLTNLFTVRDVSNLAELRDVEDGTIVRTGGHVVTARFPVNDQDVSLYIQEGRDLGIRVDGRTPAVPGDMIAVTGVVKTVNGERVITSEPIEVLSRDNPLPKPLTMMNKSLGGVAPNALYQSVKDAAGPYNVGLRVTTWGKITGTGPGWFYIDDGSKLDDGSSHIPEAPRLGIRVIGTAPEWREGWPALGWWVSVTGISGADLLDGQIIRVLRATDIWLIADSFGDSVPVVPE